MTMNTELKYFTHPTNFLRIGSADLARFFDRFKDDLKARNCEFPMRDTITETGAAALAGLLKQPETLPASLIEALLAIEEMASPENRDRLAQALTEAQPHLSLDSAASS